MPKDERVTQKKGTRKTRKSSGGGVKITAQNRAALITSLRAAFSKTAELKRIRSDALAGVDYRMTL